MCIFAYTISAISVVIAILKFDPYWMLTALLVLEAMVGMFIALSGTLRDRYNPKVTVN
jgi:hypothetical protein